MDRMIKKHTPATKPMTTPQISPVDKDESIKDNKMIEAMKTVDKVKLKQAKQPMYPRLAQENNTCEFETWSSFQKHLSILRKIF